MANGGWYGTEEEWSRIEAPLKALDPDLARFALKHDLHITKNLKDWPERSLIWETDVLCLIQIYLVDQALLTLNLWICASQDRDGNRYWKHEMLRGQVQLPEMAKDFLPALDMGKRKLDLWSAHPETLDFATKLAVWP